MNKGLQEGMCGFAGYWGCGGGERPSDLAEGMAIAVSHRGPDDSGIWIDDTHDLVLVHRRLAVLDLSAAGHQPMVSSTGRYVIVFNGEIYNHAAMREELGDFSWRGASDTETLLAGFESWGIEASIRHSVGMFAFAVWDRHACTLILGRDRLGEKPLYYGWQGNTFLFGSELKAFKAHPAFGARVDRNALALLMRHSVIPAPYSIYQGINKLLPGSLLTISRQVRNAQPVRYWDARQVVFDGLTHPFAGSPDEAVDQLETLLCASVGQQMIADVPLGAFLSGGIDSSTIVALMQAQHSRPVRTFSIGFSEAGYNEAAHARAVAKHLGTDHTELYVSAQQALDVIPRLPDIYCEPFADSSQIPTFLVSRLARRRVTVSLSGDGGDELFGGYNRYVLGKQLWGKLSYVPMWLRAVLARGILAWPPAFWDRVLGPVQGLLPLGLGQAHVGDKLHKGAAVLTAQAPSELYHLLVGHWMEPESVVLGAHDPPGVLSDSAALQPVFDTFVHEMMVFDLIGYLPDDILVKVDRAAMAVGLETRVPFLDHRVVEFAWQLPFNYKFRGGIGKWPLRQVLYKYVPRELVERPKMGFGIPVDSWLRGPLRDWAEALLDTSRLRQEEYFDPQQIRQKWDEHLSGQRNWQHLLWGVLMFQAWRERWV